VKKSTIVCTLCIGPEAEKFALYSHPSFERYAKKIGADFRVFTEMKINFTECETINPIKFEKYQLYEVLGEYDRALFVDNDILITPFAPNIFNVVPEDQIGGLYEDIAMHEQDRRRLIKEIQAILGDVGWETGYINSGVMVLSSQHRHIFKMLQQYGICDLKYEQNNTNWYIRKAGIPIFPLDYKWNFINFHRIIHGPIHREAYFIHYAGGGIFGGIPRVDQMKADYEFFYGTKS
jgi:lipopolysaccharide biosynthesis glycosyltransferase